MRSVKEFLENIMERLIKFSDNLKDIKISSKILEELYANFGKMLKSVRNFLKISRKFQRDSVWCFLRYKETLPWKKLWKKLEENFGEKTVNVLKNFRNIFNEILRKFCWKFKKIPKEI